MLRCEIVQVVTAITIPNILTFGTSRWAKIQYVLPFYSTVHIILYELI